MGSNICLTMLRENQRISMFDKLNVIGILDFYLNIYFMRVRNSELHKL